MEKTGRHPINDSVQRLPAYGGPSFFLSTEADASLSGAPEPRKMSSEERLEHPRGRRQPVKHKGLSIFYGEAGLRDAPTM
jgi:hypothetical protein